MIAPSKYWSLLLSNTAQAFASDQDSVEKYCLQYKKNY